MSRGQSVALVMVLSIIAIALIVIAYAMITKPSLTGSFIKEDNQKNTSFLAYTPQDVNQEDLDNFAKCLGEKSVLYVKAGCPHCATQEEMFGDFLMHLNIVDCAVTPQKCSEAGIEYIPTWEINGQLQPSGVKSLKELSEIAGC